MDYLEDVLSVQNSISQLNKKNSEVENKKFLKPFELGWKREVVMRVVTDSKKPNCDIYYFHPNGRKFRSMAEIKANLTDGLDPECFTFKKQPLDVACEMIRQARVRGKQPSKNRQVPKTKSREIVAKSRGQDAKLSIDDEKPRPVVRLKSRRQSMIQKKQQLKAVMNLKKAKQTRVVSKKKHKKTTAKSKGLDVNESKRKDSKVLKNNTKSKISKKWTTEKKTQTRKKEIGKEREARSSPTPENSIEGSENELSNEISKDVEDIKSIVQKNIVKYREMRRKEMLEKFERSDRSEKKCAKSETGKSACRHRTGNISENFENFLQPLEKGWKRELVYRNGAFPKGQSDVYYYHPNGRKFRSAREVTEHLTPGLSINNFTFRKEPLGCGEPKEIIRNARPHQKNLVSNFPLVMVKK